MPVAYAPDVLAPRRRRGENGKFFIVISVIFRSLPMTANQQDVAPFRERPVPPAKLLSE